MISKKKYNPVFGYLVGYEHNNITGETYPLEVMGIPIIPEMFDVFIIETFEEYFGSGRYNLLWKQTLTPLEYNYWTDKHDVTPVINLCDKYMKEIASYYTEFQEYVFIEFGLDEFTKVYQRLTPEQIQEARKYCILDSDGVPAAPVVVPVVAAADSVPAAPAAVPVVVAVDPAQAVIPVPADSSPKKKPIRPTPDLIKRVADYAARNPGATYKDIAKHFDISIETLRKGKKLRLAVDRERIGNLERHAVKPDKLFNDEN